MSVEETGVKRSGAKADPVRDRQETSWQAADNAATPVESIADELPLLTARELYEIYACAIPYPHERAVLPPGANAASYAAAPDSPRFDSQAKDTKPSRLTKYVCAIATMLFLQIVTCRLLMIHTVPTQDAASYLYQAMHLEYYLRADNTTNGIAYHGPGFPLLIRAFLPLTHNPLSATKIVVLGFAAGYLLISWKLLHLWFQPSVARIAYLLGLSMLPLLETLSSVMSDAGAAFFALAGILLLETARKAETDGDTRRLWGCVPVLLAFGAGLLMGGGYLFRYMYKLLPLCLTVGLLVFDSASMKLKSRRIVALLCGFGIVFIGWALVCQWGRGVAFPDRNHAAIVWQALDKTNSWIQFQDYADKYRLLAMFRHQGRAVLRYWAKTFYHSPVDFWLPTFTLSCFLLPLGLAVYIRNLNLARLQFLLFGVVLLLVTGFFWFETRTLLPLLFWLWGLCSLAAHSDLIPARFDMLYPEGGWLWRGIATLPLRKTVLGLLFLTLWIPMFRAKPWHYASSPMDRAAEQAGRALREISRRDEVLAASVYSIGLYADTHTIGLHEALPHDPQFADLLQLSLIPKKADYLAYIEGQSRYEYPNLQFLLTPQDPRVPANFEPVYCSASHPVVVIYRLHTHAWVADRLQDKRAKPVPNDLDDGLPVPPDPHFAVQE